jgi:HSP20 family protein
MTETQEVATRESTEVQRQEREPERVLLPPVDVFEDTEGITLQADMPGVSRDRLTLQVSEGTLLLEGDARIEMPEGMEALYADVRSTHYRRSFALSGELETDKIDASLKDGVLKLRIPKAEHAKPRKIDVKIG